MRPLFLGIDTSNYTTSLAVCNLQGKIIEEQRQILTVRTGERGLRQSDAVFQHMNHLPVLFESLKMSASDIAAVGVSVMPRPVTGSYMPVFRSGESTARILASFLNIPLKRFSHQEGHIRSALYGCALNPNDIRFPILATHFSGGTSEILLVDRREQGFTCTIVGKTLDLNAGQLIDRVGVAMGLSFPAGKALEAMEGNEEDSTLAFKSTVSEGNFHFSGVEQQAMSALKEGISKGQIAQAVFRSVAKTLEKAIRYAADQYKVRTVLFSGGVMANGLIKSVLTHRLAKGFSLYFTAPQYATDNAAGIALMARDACQLEK